MEQQLTSGFGWQGARGGGASQGRSRARTHTAGARARPASPGHRQVHGGIGADRERETEGDSLVACVRGEYDYLASMP
eukprot:3276257-Rhodomonas_salina.1